MSKRKYTRNSLLETEIVEMLAQGKSHKEIEEELGLAGDRPVHNYSKRRRRKERKPAAGVPLRSKGRPPKGYRTPEEERAYELKRLQRENELLRDFLRAVGRR